MRATRTWAFAIGLVWSSFILFMQFADEPIVPRHFSWTGAILMFAGPVTLLVASFVGLISARIAAWWMMLGATITLAIFAGHELRWSLWRFLAMATVFVLPMLVSAMLWMRYAGQLDALPPATPSAPRKKAA